MHTAAALRGSVHVVRTVHAANLRETVRQVGIRSGQRDETGTRADAGRPQARRGIAAAGSLVRHADVAPRVRRLHPPAPVLGHVGADSQREIREWKI